MCTDIWIKKVLQASFRAKTLLHGKTKQNKTKTKKKKENERRKEKENKKRTPHNIWSSQNPKLTTKPSVDY